MLKDATFWVRQSNFIFDWWTDQGNCFLISQQNFLFDPEQSCSPFTRIDWLPADEKSLLCQFRLMSRELQAFQQATAELFRNFQPHPTESVNNSHPPAEVLHSCQGGNHVSDLGRKLLMWWEHKLYKWSLPISSFLLPWFPFSFLYSLVRVANYGTLSRFINL